VILLIKPQGDMFLYAHGPHRRNWNVFFAENQIDQTDRYSLENATQNQNRQFRIKWKSKLTNKVTSQQR
jgi:hypothetical protein